MKRKHRLAFLWKVVWLLTVVLTVSLVPGFVQAQTPQFVWPVEDGANHVSQYYSSQHKAVDILESGNDKIYAAEAGTVVYAVNWHEDKPDGGWMIKIHHDSVYGGQYYTWYCHLQEASLQVSAGQTVTKGQEIATMGNTGTVQGDPGIHLHFVLANGPDIEANAINPYPDYLSGDPGDDFVDPTIQITSPGSSNAFSTQIPVSMNASDNEGGTGVRFVEVKLHYSGAWHEELTQQDWTGADGWNVTLNVPSEASGAPDVKIDAFSEDYNGNRSAPSTVTGLVIDQQAPSVNITTPSDGASFNDSIHVEADASDNRGVTQVVFKLHYQGEWRHEVQDTNGGDGWKADFTGLSVPPGTNDVKIDAIAYDELGNSAVDTVINLQPTPPDTTPPTVSVTSPIQNDLVKDTITLQASATDNVAIDRVEVAIWYVEASDFSDFRRHPFGQGNYYQMTHVGGSTWELPYNLFGTSEQAIAQTGAKVRVVAYDTNGNASVLDSDDEVTFDIKVGNQPFYVDPSLQWNQMNTYWGNVWPMKQGDSVYIQAVDLGQYQAYAHPSGGPIPPEGKTEVCLGSAYLIEDNACKALVIQTKRFDGANVKTFHIGGDGSTQAAFEAPYDGYFRLGMNDDLTKFGDNSGSWKVKVSIYPPGVSTIGTTEVRINEKADCVSGVCPHVELWVESFGTFKKLGEWTASSTSWNLRIRQDQSYLVDNADAVWLIYDNNVAGRRYYVDFVKINGVQVYSTDGGVTYYRGTGTQPFELNDPVAGQQTMNVAGGMRFPF